MTPAFSIVMPTYNRAWILSQTLQRIVNQDFQDWELIVVDDGSTDDTKSIVEALATKDARVRYIYQKNARQAAARQNGLAHAMGEWVTYIDSDEDVYPNYLSGAKAYFDAHPDVWYAFAFCDRTLELHDADHTVIATKNDPPTELDPYKVTLMHYAHWQVKPCGTGIFHRRDIITDGIAWDVSFHRFEDIDFVFQLGEKYPEYFGYIPTSLFHQRQVFGNDGICSNSTYADWADGFEAFYRKHQHAWFMQGQTWYPAKVEKYRAQQQLFDDGKLPPAWQRYFPDRFSF